MSSKIERICSAALYAMAVLMLLVGAWIVVRRSADLGTFQDVRDILLIYLLPLAAIAVLCVAIARSARISSALTVLYGASVFAAMLAAELYLQIDYYDYDAKIVRAAKQHGIPEPDVRTAYEVARDLRAHRDDVHPFFRLLTPQKEGGLVPLGNTPNKTIVYCNETGRYLIFRSDRHGFNNPDAVWDRDATSVMLIGDSFTHGACDPQNRGFANLLREAYPDLINIGVGGNEPLTNLATLVEYVVPRRPKVVIWAHYAGNDLIGLESKKKKPYLRDYARAGHSQGLYGRPQRVETEMNDFFERVVSADMQKGSQKTTVWQRIDPLAVAKLQVLRESLGLTKQLRTTVDWDLFERIMLRAKRETDLIGARLIFVSIPSGAQVHLSAATPWEEKSFAILKRLGIEHHDLRADLHELTDPTNAYMFGRQGGHFSPVGSRTAADALRAIIESGGKVTGPAGATAAQANSH